MARPKGALNHRSQMAKRLLAEQFDLDPLLELAELIKKRVPLTNSSGEIVYDKDGNEVMVPYLSGSEMVTGLGKLMDKTYPTLKAQEIDHKGDGLPTVVVDMQGLSMDTKPARKRRAPAKKESTK